MTTQNLVNARRSIALTQETIDGLKLITKSVTDINVKMYEVVAAMVELTKSNEDFCNQVIEVVRQKKSAKVKPAYQSLSPSLKAKLDNLSAEDLAALLEKAGV
jgi:methyl-accepting chemotaxis protein